MTEAGEHERLMTKRELADRWRVSEKTIDREIKRHGLPTIRIGRQQRFRMGDIVAYEKKKRS